MGLRLDPPLREWRPRQPRVVRGADRAVIAERVAERAGRMGSGVIASGAPDGSGSPARPVVATGHQASLWHPGILVKDLAAAEAARRLGGVALHVLADQDVHEAWRIDLPVVEGDRLRVASRGLAATQGGVPTGRQPAAGSFEVSGIAGLDAALSEAAGRSFETLAEQAGFVAERYRSGVMGAATPVAAATDLAHTARFGELVDRMTDDPLACVSAYNAAAGAVPEAGMGELKVTDRRVELPLWSSPWQGGRLRVFAEKQEGGGYALRAGGKPVDRGDLLPRALLMTGLWRDGLCDLFVHGVGGGVYRRVTDLWWERWLGEGLAPVVVATADVRVDFAVPVAEPEEVRRAVWRRHWLPHNLDRALGLSGEAVQRKRSLLDRMGDDRDRRRRARAFRELSEINAGWVEQHRGEIEAADSEAARAQAGLANRASARRRDWALAVYPDEALARLWRAVQDSA